MLEQDGHPWAPMATPVTSGHPGHPWAPWAPLLLGAEVVAPGKGGTQVPYRTQRWGVTLYYRVVTPGRSIVEVLRPVLYNRACGLRRRPPPAAGSGRHLPPDHLSPPSLLLPASPPAPADQRAPPPAPVTTGRPPHDQHTMTL